MIYGALFSLIILIFILGVFFVWLSTKTSDSNNPMTTAKDICLTTLAKQGTNIWINSPMIIEKKDNSILVRKSQTEVGFSYPCQGNFDIDKVGDGYLITIK